MTCHSRQRGYDDRKIATSVDSIAHLILGKRGLALEFDERHVEVATALVLRGEHVRARRVLLCPPIEGGQYDMARKPCRLRACPTCSERRAWRLAGKLEQLASGYTHPVVLLVAAPSRSSSDLKLSVSELKLKLVTLRRRAWFASACPRGVIAVECPPTNGGYRWNVHAHGICDVAPDIREEFAARAQADWSELRGAGAVFGLETLRNESGLAQYSFKVGGEKSWSPMPDTVTAAQWDELDHALRGARLLIAWGTKRSQNPRCS